MLLLHILISSNLFVHSISHNTVFYAKNDHQVAEKVQIKSKKSNFHYTRRITPKRVTSCGAHLRGLAPGQQSSEESSQRWQVVGDTVPI